MAKAAFFGPPGSNGHEALQRYLDRWASGGPEWVKVPCDAQSDTISAVASGKAEIGIFAFENSTIGPVLEVERRLYQALRDGDGITLVGEVEMPIAHYLLGPGGKLDDVRETISHPAAGGQCQSWLREHGIEFRAFGSTAAAVEQVMKDGDPRRAAIGSRLAAEIYHANILAENIQDEQGNSTTFLLVGREPAQRSGRDRSIILFEPKTAYETGALHRALGPFTLWHVNMYMIHTVRYSLPNGSTGGLKPVRFYVGIEGHLDESNIARAVQEMSGFCEVFHSLGSFPAW